AVCRHIEPPSKFGGAHVELFQFFRQVFPRVNCSDRHALAWLRESSSAGSLAAPTPPAAHPHSDPAHSEHPLLRLLSPPAPAAFLPPPAIAFRPPASVRSSLPCACSHWLSPCCHPTSLAPASSSPPATRSAAFGQTTLAAPTD